MSKRNSANNKQRSSTPSWLDDIEDKAEEEVIPHTPKSSKKKEPRWAYTLTEGGKRHYVDLPKTDSQISKVRNQLIDKRNWRRYHKNPYGGSVNYTQINCFPPFDYLRVAQVYFPNGEVWNSRTRRFKTVD